MLARALATTCLVILLAGLALPVAASGGSAQDVDPTLQAYRESVRLLCEGRREEAVAMLAAVDRQWLAGPVGRVKQGIREHVAEYGRPFVQAAVLLHLDLFMDPRVSPAMRATHAAVAWDLSDEAPGLVPRAFLRDCRLMVAWFLQRDLAVEDLVVQLGAALREFPDDADLLLAKGSLWELMAALPGARDLRLEENDATREISRPTLDDSGRHAAQVDVASPRIHERCARLYERVLQRSPQLDDARLRLARVLTLAGQPGQALDVLDPLLRREPGDLRLESRYLATLFHGRAALDLGRAETAVASYRAALLMFPGCQAPQVALSSALRAAGDGPGARLVTSAMLAVSQEPDCPDDPWWRYPEGQAWRLGPLVERLHEAVRP